MKRLTGLFIAGLLLLNSCGNVPLTGRKQVMLVSEQEVLAGSLTQYNSFMKDAIRSTDKAQTDKVLRVGKNIAAAAETYLKNNGLEAEISHFAWEFNCVKSDEVNAFCMPGGKIVVYEGIMPFAATDGELAAVVGHEVAHAVAKHANERMSQQMLAQYGGTILGEAVGKTSSTVQTLANTVYGLGTEYGIMLPYSRKHEYEADHIGLIFMAMAGYDPQAAIAFWTKMAQGKTASVPEFMSTHPSDAHRIAELQQYLPEALRYYKQ
jgi:predicted Zn-dependent protease